APDQVTPHGLAGVAPVDGAVRVVDRVERVAADLETGLAGAEERGQAAAVDADPGAGVDGQRVRRHPVGVRERGRLGVVAHPVVDVVRVCVGVEAGAASGVAGQHPAHGAAVVIYGVGG